MNVYSHKVLDIIGTTVELENLENNLSQFKHSKLKKFIIRFYWGNDLDILIDTNVDIESIVSKVNRKEQ